MRQRAGAGAGVVLLVVLLAGCGGGGGSGSGPGSATLRVSGSTTVNPVAADASEVLRRDGLRITVDTSGGSAGGIAQLGAGQIDVAMSSKPLADSDRQMFPAVDFVPTEIGQDAVGVVIRREVFDSGVKNLTKDQVRALFEGRVRNWSELGGPDLAVFVYDKEPGRGTREAIDKYLYGTGKAPAPPQSDTYAIVGGNEEERTKLLSTPGSVGPLSSSFVDGYPKLAVVSLDGIEPSPENVRASRYPISRPLYLITDGQPQGASKRFVDYVLSEPGQKLVNKHGFLNLTDLGLR